MHTFSILKTVHSPCKKTMMKVTITANYEAHRWGFFYVGKM